MILLMRDKERYVMGKKLEPSNCKIYPSSFFLCVFSIFAGHSHYYWRKFNYVYSYSSSIGKEGGSGQCKFSNG